MATLAERGEAVARLGSLVHHVNLILSLEGRFRHFGERSVIPLKMGERRSGLALCPVRWQIQILVHEGGRCAMEEQTLDPIVDSVGGVLDEALQLG